MPQHNSDFVNRIRLFQSLLKKNKVDCAFFVADERENSNIMYFTGIPLTHSAFLVPSSGKPALYVTSLDFNSIRPNKNFLLILLIKPLAAHLKAGLGSKNVLGLDYNTTPYALAIKLRKSFPKLKLKDISEIIGSIRTIKSNGEIGMLEKAASLASASYESMLSSFSYRTESEVKAALEYEMAKRGCAPAFPTIVASGANAAVPHHKTSSVRLLRGFCIIDFGANYKGYCSDCTRTIFIGKPNKNELNLYGLLLGAQQSCIEMVGPNVFVSSIDSFARKKLGRYSKYFTHGLGHGIGIDVHEAPNISQKSRSLLQENMAVTIEPGIYIKGKFGIRIEDTIVVKKKPKILTTISKSLHSVQISRG